MKVLFKEKKLSKEECKKEVATLLREENADIQVDTLLYQACLLDERTFCSGVPQGSGQKARCLLDQWEKEKAAERTGQRAALPRKKGVPPSLQEEKLSEGCRRMLADRFELWQFVGDLRRPPPDSLGDVAVVINESPSRFYLILMLVLIVGLICICGAICGRTSHRYIKLPSKMV